jgi:hypothetical protein
MDYRSAESAGEVLTRFGAQPESWMMMTNRRHPSARRRENPWRTTGLNRQNNVDSCLLTMRRLPFPGRGQQIFCFCCRGLEKATRRQKSSSFARHEKAGQCAFCPSFFPSEPAPGVSALKRTNIEPGGDPTNASKSIPSNLNFILLHCLMLIGHEIKFFERAPAATGSAIWPPFAAIVSCSRHQYLFFYLYFLKFSIQTNLICI